MTDKPKKESLSLALVKVENLEHNPLQPRQNFDEERLRELADSFKSQGEIQPIIVRRHDGKYQIICGERRWRAARIAGIKEIPALIRDTAEQDILLESLVENMHREDLTSVERENAVYSLWKTGRWKTHEELGRAVGKTQGWVRQNVETAELRKKERISSEVSTGTIYDTLTLEKEDRKKLIAKVERDEIPVKSVRDYARVIKIATQPVKEAILKPKSSITPKIAETIVEKLPSQKDQEAVLKETLRHRLTEDEVVTRVQDIKRSREEGKVPTVERQIVIQGQWLVDRLRKPITDLLIINPDAFNELGDRQRGIVTDLLTQLQNRVQQWLSRLKGHEQLGSVSVNEHNR